MINEKEFDIILEKYLSGSATAEEGELVDRWFQQSHKTVPVGGEEDLSPIREEILQRIKANLKEEPKTVRIAPRTIATNLWKYAAVILLLIIGGYNLYQSHMTYTEPNWITKSTQNGQQLELILEDGTHVMLNAASSISFPEKFAKDHRSVKMTGEVFFKVNRDTERPFTIHTASLVTQVLGTSFNVKSYEEELPKVSVLEGKVKVHTPLQPEDGVVLVANQEALLTAEGALKKQQSNINAVLAWKSGVISLENTSLKEVARIIQRVYDKQVTFESQELGELTISGRFKHDKLSNLLNQICFIKKLGWELAEDNSIKLKNTHN
ncbi:FecR domain-containing protein [Limibacter armeniacum]|uniref:FecR family protein n=1 Tax=Limibacter armeniacum TaxID=466084 RepID=UPI002FE5E023